MYVSVWIAANFSASVMCNWSAAADELVEAAFDAATLAADFDAATEADELAEAAFDTATLAVDLDAATEADELADAAFDVATLAADFDVATETDKEAEAASLDWTALLLFPVEAT